MKCGFASECIKTMDESGRRGMRGTMMQMKQRIICGLISVDDVLFEWEVFPLCDTLNDLELYNR